MLLQMIESVLSIASVARRQLHCLASHTDVMQTKTSQRAVYPVLLRLMPLSQVLENFEL